MTWLGVWLVGVGLADLVRGGGERPGRERAAVLVGAVAVVLTALLAGLHAPVDLVVLVGSLVALATAIAHPARVARLALLDVVAVIAAIDLEAAPLHLPDRAGDVVHEVAVVAREQHRALVVGDRIPPCRIPGEEGLDRPLHGLDQRLDPPLQVDQLCALAPHLALLATALGIRPGRILLRVAGGRIEVDRAGRLLLATPHLTDRAAQVLTAALDDAGTVA